MCLILFAWEYSPKYKLVLAANRDEFYSRPTSPVSFWDDFPAVLAGRDLKSFGSWLGINKRGCFAAITNHRDPGSMNPYAPSRGLLVGNFLTGNDKPRKYIEDISKTGSKYNGFNLLIGDMSELYYYSNIENDIRKIEHGLFGLSNDVLDTPWPKIEKGKRQLRKLINKKDEIESEEIFSILANRDYPGDGTLPDTGVGDVWEKILSPMFITSKIYGTRSSSVLLIEKSGKIAFFEKTFELVDGEPVETKSVKYAI